MSVSVPGRESKAAPTSSATPRTRMVTILPQMENVHVHKDVGKVPLHLAAAHGYDCEIWSYANGEYHDWPVELEARHLRRSGSRLAHYATFARALAREASRIPVLSLYHIKLQSLILGSLYKAKNPRGVLYLKADVDARVQALLDSRLRRVAVRRLLRVSDVVSFEAIEMHELFAERFPELCEKFLHLPNGFDLPEGESAGDALLPKEKLMIAVGRLDAEQKAIPNLLTALGRVGSKLGEWRFELIGPFVGIQSEVAEFQCAHPELADRVVFRGPIWDREKLDRVFQRASVLLLPSRWEGFPLVLPQAACRGCFVVGHDVGGMRDVSDDGRLGRVSAIGDIDALAADLEWCVSHPDEVARLGREQLQRSERFHWKPIVDALAARLDEARG